MTITKLAKADVDGDIVDYAGRKLAIKQSVTDLSTTVAAKADASALASLSSTVAAKADASALTGLATAASVTTVSTAVGTLASLTTAAKNSVVAAVNELVVSIGNRLRVDGTAQTITAANAAVARTSLGVGLQIKAAFTAAQGVPTTAAAFDAAGIAIGDYFTVDPS